jgi:hypothetical protein
VAFLALAGLLLISGPAEATSITSPTGTVATPTIKAESEGHVSIHNPIATISCASNVEAKVESHGNETAATGKVSALSFTGCTDSWHVTVVAAGTLTVTHTSGYNGDVFSSGVTIETTRFGTTCRYSTSNTTMGTLTGGSPATIDLSANIPFHSGSVFCGSSTTTWTGSYTISSPSSLYVDKEVVVEPTPEGTSITSPTGTVSTPTIEAESEGHISLDHPIAKIECQWAIEGTVKRHNPERGAEVPLSSLSTTGCTESWHATTVTAGELEIDWTSDYNGTVTWSGGTVEMTRLGTTCRYKSDSTYLGALTGGSPATIDIEGNLPFHSGSPLCGTESYPLTGSLKLSNPNSLYVDNEVDISTSITSPTGTVATPTIKAEAEGHAVLDNPISKIECSSPVEATIEKHGNGESASGKISTLSFPTCTDSWHVTVVAPGTFFVRHASGYDGDVFSNSATVEATRFGISCRYATKSTRIGTLTGGVPATIDIAASIPFHSGSVFCGSGATAWTGAYKVTSPSSLYVDNN